LFRLFLGGILRRALDGKKRGITWKLKKSFEDTEYADDVCLSAHRFEHMQRKLDVLWQESKKVAIAINSSKKEEIHVNTIVNQDLIHRLNKRDIKRSSDVCYLGSVVSDNCGARIYVNVRFRKARGSISKLRKVWPSTSIRKIQRIVFVVPA
jgi:hypothetical protein